MEKANNNFQMEISIQENMLMVYPKDTVNIYGLMEALIKVI